MKLSIITINKNNASGLEKTIQSVINQTYTNFEYIIIDGGSSDESIDIINQYKDKITYWISESDKGIYNAMNKGIDKAKGEYCLFLNSGDYLYTNDVLKDLFSNSFTEDLIIRAIKIEYVKKNDFRIFSIGVFTKITKSFIFNNTLPHPSTLIKRELFYKIGKYDEIYKISGDYEFFARAIKKNCTYRIYTLIVSVWNDQGISNTQLQLGNSENLKLLKKHFLLKTIVNKIKLLIPKPLKKLIKKFLRGVNY